MLNFSLRLCKEIWFKQGIHHLLLLILCIGTKRMFMVLFTKVPLVNQLKNVIHWRVKLRKWSEAACLLSEIWTQMFKEIFYPIMGQWMLCTFNLLMNASMISMNQKNIWRKCTLFYELNYFPLHYYSACSICSNSIHECKTVDYDLQGLMDREIISMMKRIRRNEEVNSVNMVQWCHGEFWIYDVCWMRGDLVQIHATMSILAEIMIF